MDHYEIVEKTERRKRDWVSILVPLSAVLAVNLVGIALAYGKLDQRVSTLELLRIESRAEVQAQIADIRHTLDSIDSKLTVLLRRP